MLSGYRLMWLIVLFDLPVTTKKDRKIASKFRQTLVNIGYEMVQFSVYMKFAYSKEQSETIISQLTQHTPAVGNVKIIRITDKQFSQILHLGDHTPRQNQHTQLALF